MNKKMVLLVLALCVSMTLAGCGSKQKAPEGVGQDFYDDMIECLKLLEKHKGNDDKNGVEIINNYKENKLWLSPAEREIVEAVSDMYFWVWLYYDSDNDQTMIARDTIMTVSNLTFF